METKKCCGCGIELPVSYFHKNKAHKDGLTSRCKACETIKGKRFKATPRGQATQAWSNIYWRSENRDGHHPYYLKILLQMTQEEFLAWAEPKYIAWQTDHPGVKPSVDRIDPDGHYELQNLQIIAFKANCAKVRPHPATATHIARMAVGLAARWQVDIQTVINEIKAMA